MEHFNCNCCFCTTYLSYPPDISDALITKLLAEVFDLVNAGHIGPVHPVITYRFDYVIDAIALMRSGKHMEKIVLSSGASDMQRPIWPAVRKLELTSDATYMLIGFLKGTCGSLTVYVARYRVRYLILLSRSGMGNKSSAKITEHYALYQCEVMAAKGDISGLTFVRSLFRSIHDGKIADIVKGAIVMQDKPFGLMTHDDYHTAIPVKV
jgi:hypothetical protein